MATSNSTNAVATEPQQIPPPDLSKENQCNTLAVAHSGALAFGNPFERSRIEQPGLDQERRPSEPLSPRSSSKELIAVLRKSRSIRRDKHMDLAAAARGGHDPLSLSVEELRSKARWIRDTLEPGIAREGPRCLAPDTVLDLNSFLSTLFTITYPPRNVKPSITRETLEASRIHRALLLIRGRGTRWPSKLVEICDGLIAAWTEKFGKLDMIRPSLYEKGGRLEKCKEERDMKRHDLMIKWMSDPTGLVSSMRAQESGHLDFKPGSWWIHPIFAFHAGIVDSPEPNGGITADGDGAYGVLLTANDEVHSATPEEFTYRCHNDDKGRFRLIGASLPPKNSIRVLRSHNLHSQWSPAAGVRYDGLYKIVKWSLRRINDQVVYDIGFRRDMDQTISMREVLLHPTAEEVDDYIEYKRLREERHAREEGARRAALSPDELEAEDTAAETELGQEEPKVSLVERKHSTLSIKEGDTTTSPIKAGDTSPVSPTAKSMAPASLYAGGTAGGSINATPAKASPHFFADPHQPWNAKFKAVELDGTANSQAGRRTSVSATSQVPRTVSRERSLSAGRDRPSSQATMAVTKEKSPVAAQDRRPSLRRQGRKNSYLFMSMTASESSTDDAGPTNQRRSSIRFIPIEESPFATELSQQSSNHAPPGKIPMVNRVRFCDEMSPAEVREEQLAWVIRKDSAQFTSRSTSSDTSPAKTANLTLDGSSDLNILGRRYTIANNFPDHQTLQRLASQFNELKSVTLRRNSVSSTFLEDLKNVSRVLEGWELASAGANGYVDSCLKNLERDVHAMCEHGKFEWRCFADDRQVDPGVELAKLEEYQKRYEERNREDERIGDAQEDVKAEEENAATTNLVVTTGSASGSVWMIGETVDFY